MKIALVYMVAGISSRYGGKMKAFADIGKGTLIEYSLQQAIPAGFSKIIFIVGNKTEKAFRDFFGNNYKGIPVEYVKQEFDEATRDKPWGTADALCTLGDFNSPFIICNGDDIYGSRSFKKLAEHLKSSKDDATLGYRLGDAIPETGKTYRAMFTIDKDSYAQNLVETFNIEKNNLSSLNLKLDDMCSMNIFAFHPKIIELLKIRLEKFKKEHEGDRKIEFLLPNEVGKLVNERKIRMKVYPAMDKWYGITNPGDEIIIKNSIA